MWLNDYQKINNYIQSEQLKRNGRKPESSKSIRSLYRAGFSCLRVLPFLTIGLLLSGCFGSTLTTIGPIQIKQADIITTPTRIILANKDKEK